MGGDGPSTELMKRYEETGVSRLVVAVAAAAHGDGIKAVQAVGAVAERATHV